MSEISESLGEAFEVFEENRNSDYLQIGSLELPCILPTIERSKDLAEAGGFMPDGSSEVTVLLSQIPDSVVVDELVGRVVTLKKKKLKRLIVGASEDNFSVTFSLDDPAK
ncbi:hypothetical protein [Rubellicoccus peritrichatus]|uniref:Uncharacterized protein n=1 Tax=Rubellicoccus peritrichatus TaxID=3080537 RepID=A0AAQ3LEB6_9BACT|nr:hypothetical protein [Puniceicoccus sp. CR14]WOO40380.1 hypothetical protein RZN69_17310 [Puniceicoccus sp. CR14]WOO40429.1 hypothetical protein RZN69_17555 [Puniceicoccus sp. CR14]WOO40478.1 hypothetical protein RZN69_17800 [Puniceicoccus sp. CR14]WOO40527.1 hypothetical protein RZN69_18045 [Puniceicoccus sp. CR14]